MTNLQKQDNKIEELRKVHEDPEYENIALRKRGKNFLIKNHILYKRNTRTDGNEHLLVIPHGMRREILYQNHNEPVAGHLGFSKTFNRIRDRYYWDSMQADIEKDVKGCPNCQARKGQTHLRPAGFFKPLTVGQPFDRVGIDFLGPFRRRKRGKVVIVVATDYATRWVEARALPNGKVEHVARFVVEQIICRHGAPRILFSDRGKVFQSQVVKEILNYLGSENRFTTAYHPQTNGLTERFNKTLAGMLSKYTNTAHTDWDEYIPHVVFAYNTAVQDTTQMTPFKLLYGRSPILPSEAQVSNNIETDEAKRTLKYVQKFAE